MYTKGQLERSLSPSVVRLSLQEHLNDLGWNKKINKKKIGAVNRRKRHSAWCAVQRVLQPHQKVSVRTQEKPSVNQQKSQSAAGRLVTRSYKFILLPSLFLKIKNKIKKNSKWHFCTIMSFWGMGKSVVQHEWSEHLQWWWNDWEHTVMTGLSCIFLPLTNKWKLMCYSSELL